MMVRDDLRYESAWGDWSFFMTKFQACIECHESDKPVFPSPSHGLTLTSSNKPEHGEALTTELWAVQFSGT